MSQGFGQRSVFEVELPNGRSPNICTEEGALEFIRFEPKWLSMGLRGIIATRKNNDPDAYTHCKVLVEIPTALNGKHADKLPVSEFKAAVKFYEWLCSDLNTTKWKETGALGEQDQDILSGVVAWSHYPMFVKEMMPRGFRCLATLMESSRCFPDPQVATTVLMAVHNARTTLEELTTKQARALRMPEEYVDNPSYSLEATGIVAQAMRLLLTPSLNSNMYLSGGLHTGLLSENLQLLKERFAPDKPSGEILKRLLDGADPWTVASQRGPRTRAEDKTLVMSKFKLIQKLSLGEGTVAHSSCRKCNKSRCTLMKCGRCKGANYCSRECQKADWKKHKKVCTVSKAGGSQMSTNINPETILWFQKHHMEIMEEVNRLRSALCLPVKDMVVEIDLQTSSDPAVLVKPFSAYVAGNEAGPGMPDWTGCREDKHFVMTMQDAHERCTDKNILLVHRSIDTEYGVCRMGG